MSDPVDLVKSLIVRELEAVHAFIDVLKRETEVLSSGSDPNLLADVVQSKWYRANSLQSLHLQRVALLDSMGIKDGQIGLLTDLHPEIKSLWDQLVPVLKEAREMNDANGVMIDTFLKSTDEAISVLRVARGEGNVYGANGRSAAKHSRVLATT